MNPYVNTLEKVNRYLIFFRNGKLDITEMESPQLQLTDILTAVIYPLVRSRIKFINTLEKVNRYSVFFSRGKLEITKMESSNLQIVILYLTVSKHCFAIEFELAFKFRFA